MAATPGTQDYYRLPIAQRVREYNESKWTVAAQGAADSVPQSAYFTAQELAFMQAQNNTHLAAWQQEVKDKFPSQAPYLDNPEIANILHDGVIHHWPPEVLQSHLEASVWWRSHSQQQRQWHQLNQTDPAAALQSVQQQFDTIHQQAASLGLNMSAATMMQLASESLSMGWNQQELTNHMIQSDKTSPHTGSMGVTRDQLKGMASDYLLPTNDKSLDEWTRKIAAGTATLDTYKDQLERLAMNRYSDPAVRDALQRGMTIKDFADPYVQSAAQTLGLNPNSVDINDPKWNKAIDYVDPKTGNRRSMTMGEWDQEIKMNPIYGYDSSTPGVQQAASFVANMRAQFGVS